MENLGHQNTPAKNVRRAAGLAVAGALLAGCSARAANEAPAPFVLQPLPAIFLQPDAARNAIANGATTCEITKARAYKGNMNEDTGKVESFTSVTLQISQTKLAAIAIRQYYDNESVIWDPSFVAKEYKKHGNQLAYVGSTQTTGALGQQSQNPVFETNTALLLPTDGLQAGDTFKIYENETVATTSGQLALNVYCGALEGAGNNVRWAH